MPALMLELTVLSAVGLRGNNEDAAFACSRLVGVAAGVGGAVACELASGAAIMKMVALDKRRLTPPREWSHTRWIATADR